MSASSSTFRPHPGRVIGDLFRQLHAVWHGMEALVYSNHPREAAASSYLAIIFGRIASGLPWSSAQLRCQCSSRISAGAGVGRGSLKYWAIAWLITLGLSPGMLPFLLLLWGLSNPTIQHEDSGAARNATEFQQ